MTLDDRRLGIRYDHRYCLGTMWPLHFTHAAMDGRWMAAGQISDGGWGLQKPSFLILANKLFANKSNKQNEEARWFPFRPNCKDAMPLVVQRAGGPKGLLGLGKSIDFVDRSILWHSVAHGILGPQDKRLGEARSLCSISVPSCGRQLWSSKFPNFLSCSQ